MSLPCINAGCDPCGRVPSDAAFTATNVKNLQVQCLDSCQQGSLTLNGNLVSSFQTVDVGVAGVPVDVGPGVTTIQLTGTNGGAGFVVDGGALNSVAAGQLLVVINNTTVAGDDATINPGANIVTQGTNGIFVFNGISFERMT